MSQFNFNPFINAVFLVTLLSSLTSLSFAQESQPSVEPSLKQETKQETKQAAGWWSQGKTKTLDILDKGELSLMLSGYARHGRHTYTAQRISELNELAWGLGFSKTIRDEKDNEEFIYGLAISDSHFKPQLMAGYAYQWMKPLGGQYEAGLGVTGLLFSRTDYFGGIPFPGVVPVMSIGTRSAKLMGAYIPRISRNKGNGDVLLMFVRFELN
jgi:hypothetical protein